MNILTSAVAPILLLLSLVLGIAASAISARHAGTLGNFRTMFLGMYVVVYPISGLMHLGMFAGHSRGFFDMARSSSAEHVVAISLVIFLGTILISAIATKKSRISQPHSSSASTRASQPSKPGYWVPSVVISLIVLPFAIVATAQLSAYAETVTSGRVYMLTGGLARLSFASNWFAWATSLLCLAALYLMGRRSGGAKVVVLAAAVSAIASSLFWTGGRSVIVLMVLPLLLVAWPLLGRVRWLLLVAMTTVFASYVLAVSVSRSTASSTSESTLVSALDWEWGRFSMLGLAAKHVDHNGLLSGETLWTSIVSVPRAVLGFAGLPVDYSGLTISQYIGLDLFGDQRVTYVVAGILPEFYMNFGAVGMLAGLALLSWAVVWVDDKYRNAAGPVERLLFAYVGVIIVFRTLSADSGAIFSYLLLSGLPLLVAGVLAVRSTRIPRAIRSAWVPRHREAVRTLRKTGY